MIENKLVIVLPLSNDMQPAVPADLTQTAAGKEVIVVIPAEDILLTSAKMPKMSSSRLAQALPFALEEQLVGDIESLHFACAGNQADGSMPVAVVAKEKMRQWLALLQSWNIRADAFVPAMLALPYSSDTWHIMISDMVYARTGLFQGFACDWGNLGKFLAIALAGAEIKPGSLRIHNYSGRPVEVELDAKMITIKETMLPAARMISDLGLNMENSPVLNLLQGEFAVKKSRFPQMRKMTRALTYLAAAWIFLLFLYPTVSYFILNHRVSSIDAQIAEIYQRNFPQSASLVAPKLRMEEKLQKLNTQVGENRYLLLLGYVGKAMRQASSGIALKRMEFQNNQMTLELTAQSSDDFSAFTDFLTRQGLSVKQQNANLAGTRVDASVVVE